MATRAQNLQTALNQMAERLVEVTASPQMTYSVDGKSYDKNGYINLLINDMKPLEDALARASGPYEISTRGVI